MHSVRCIRFADDLLDLLGDKGRGHDNPDLWEGKPSLVVSLTLGRLQEEERSAFLRELFKPRALKTPHGVRALRSVIDATGAIASSRALLELRIEACIEAAAEISPRLSRFVAELTRLLTLGIPPNDGSAELIHTEASVESQMASQHTVPAEAEVSWGAHTGGY